MILTANSLCHVCILIHSWESVFFTASHYILIFLKGKKKNCVLGHPIYPAIISGAIICEDSFPTRDYAGPKLSGDVVSLSRRFRATFLQTERQQTACSSRPYPLNKACFPSITLFTFGLHTGISDCFYSVIFADVSLIAQHNRCNGLLTLIKSLSVVN